MEGELQFNYTMKRIDILKKASEFRHKLGDINRQLAFAGIAIIWIFKIKDENDYSLPEELLIAVKYIVISLGLDLLHYIWLAGLYVFYHWFQEKIKKKPADSDIKFSYIIPRISDLFLLAKVGFTILGFCKILSYLNVTINSI